jgi:hypothetical protein
MAHVATEKIPSPEARHGRVEGVAWFTVMVGMWSAFSTLLIASPETLGRSGAG